MATKRATGRPLFAITISSPCATRSSRGISQVGFVMILLLMVTVLWFDLAKNLPKGLLPGS